MDLSYENVICHKFLTDRVFLKELIKAIEEAKTQKELKDIPYNRVLESRNLRSFFYTNPDNQTIEIFKHDLLIAIACIEYYVSVYKKYRYEETSVSNWIEFESGYLEPTMDVIYEKYVKNNPNFYVNNPLRETFTTAFSSYFREHLYTNCKEADDSVFMNFFKIKFDYKRIGKFIIHHIAMHDKDEWEKTIVETFDTLRNPVSVEDLLINGFKEPIPNTWKQKKYKHVSSQLNECKNNFMIYLYNHAILSAFGNLAIEKLKNKVDAEGSFNKTVTLMNAFFISSAEQTRHYIFKAVDAFNKSSSYLHDPFCRLYDKKTLKWLQDSTSLWFDETLIYLDSEVNEENEPIKHKIALKPSEDHVAKVMSPYMTMLSKIESIEPSLFSAYMSRVDECTSYLDVPTVRFTIYDNFSFNTEKLRDITKNALVKLNNIYTNDFDTAVDELNECIEKIEKDLPKKYNRIWFVINDMIDTFKFCLGQVFGDRGINHNRYYIKYSDTPFYRNVAGFTSHKFEVVNDTVRKITKFISNQSAFQPEFKRKFFYDKPLEINHETLSIGEEFEVLDNFEHIEAKYNRLQSSTVVAILKYFNTNTDSFFLDEKMLPDEIDTGVTFVNLKFVEDNYNKEIFKQINHMNDILINLYEHVCIFFDEFNADIITLTSAFAYWAEKSMRRLTVLDIDPLYDLNRMLQCEASVINELYCKIKP